MKQPIYRSHRGGVYETPENTMPAFKAALQQGYEMIETDPCYTKDGEIVLFHDGTINRTCRRADGSKIEEPILLRDLTYAELMEFDAGIAKGPQFAGTKVPRLAELLTLLDGKEVELALDKKIPVEKMDPLFDLLEKYNVKVRFSCSDLARVRKVLARFPNASFDYDVNISEEELQALTAEVKRENVIVWLYLDKPNFAWLTDVAKVTAERCAMVKKYAALGIANINNPCDVREALQYAPDVIEV